MGDLTGRTALITGAGQNVGAYTAHVLASEGAHVAVNDLFSERAERVVEEIRSAGGSAETAVCDVTDLTAVTETFARVEKIDILVNNAGIPVTGFALKNFVDDDPSTWKSFVDLNVYGPMNCTHVVLSGMIERGWGRIITISSESARAGDRKLGRVRGLEGSRPRADALGRQRGRAARHHLQLLVTGHATECLVRRCDRHDARATQRLHRPKARPGERRGCCHRVAHL